MCSARVARARTCVRLQAARAAVGRKARGARASYRHTVTCQNLDIAAISRQTLRTVQCTGAGAKALRHERQPSTTASLLIM
jgi:hypothetical protein